MKAKIRWFMAILLLLASFAMAAGPDVRLKDFDGKDRNANEFIGQGKWVVVAVWSADCPICRRDIYHMTFFHDEHRKSDAIVLGLSIDGYVDREKAQGFINDQSLNFPNLIGEPSDAERLGPGMFVGTPTYYFYSPEGKYMTQRIGPLTQEQANDILRELQKKQTKAIKK
jgi:hypothetical protein